MMSEIEKMSVAENCYEFKPRSTAIIGGLKNTVQSCSNCINFVGEECSNGTFEHINNQLKLN